MSSWQKQVVERLGRSELNPQLKIRVRTKSGDSFDVEQVSRIMVNGFDEGYKYERDGWVALVVGPSDGRPLRDSVFLQLSQIESIRDLD